VLNVIVPVYKGIEDTQECLDAVVDSKSRNSTLFQVIVINDCSPDPEIDALLKGYSDKGAIHLIKHKENQGFVRSVNEGMRHDHSSDVVLLNSDAIAANDWLDRLWRCAYSDNGIGTVTPFSNNATICSFPDFCRENKVLKGFSVAEIDNAFSNANKGGVVEIPTAVGFCVYIKRKCIDEVGLFNETAFGRGYGEENDFCRRAVKLGWRNVLCADVFVAHVGGVSFAEEKPEKVENAQIQINRLHPEYDQCVQQHIQEDPAKAYRIKVLMELTAQSELPKVLFVTHQLGGGVEKHVFELCSYLDEQAISLKLILNGDGYFSISFHWGELDKLIFRIPNEYDDLVELLEKLGISHIHFHHTMGIDPVLWRLPDRLGVTLDYTLHDYYLINANPTLTDKNGLFCPEKKQRDMLGSSHYDIPGGISANDWRENQKILLNKCRHIFSPSQYAVNLFREYFPDYSPIVAYHPDYDLDYPYPDPQGLDHEDGRPLKILVLGAISREKGAHVLEETASTAVAKKLPLEFNLLGYAYRPLAKAVKIHGPYNDDNIDQLIKEIAPDIIWFPALWPET